MCPLYSPICGSLSDQILKTCFSPVIILLKPSGASVVLEKKSKSLESKGLLNLSLIQLLSRLTVCNPRDCSTPGFPVHHQLLEFTQIHIHPAILSSVIPFSSCPQSLPASGSFPMSQSSHEVAKVLEFQHQHQSFQ